MAKFLVKFDGEVCKGCELCRTFCPKKIIVMSTHINNKGYCPPMIEKPEECIGCASCATMCHDGAISISKED